MSVEPLYVGQQTKATPLREVSSLVLWLGSMKVLIPQMADPLPHPDSGCQVGFLP